MIKKPTYKPSRYDDLDTTNLTIKKMLEIWDILFFNNPRDKRFKNNADKYLMDLFIIIKRIEDDNDYSDTDIKIAIDNLYNKIFKNRRHL